ncbi:ABC transporter ATP-binding protein [Pikeienuella piscinae]|uniref:ABC transporter ATP-binding protein n=1 Tax=Pikeienuella piscinae TaxID=2748098 RepID=A0A7L5BUA6_9RHOB|nr:dipeptide ABC transporter ATP-binding protein [Pikeienuella piscinae]QIE55172.1 ABC transporter ATP-binding protein [Pikeienuella piscinae]
MSLLEIDRLSLGIHELPILKDVSFAIAAGEVFGVIGESGSGKSLTAYSVMRLLPRGAAPTGAVRLDGEDLLAKSEREMCRVRGAGIGMVFQEPMTALNPVRTIGEQVAETALIHGAMGRREAMANARAMLDRVGLPAERFPLDRYPHELSGGQRQRVVIAMAIALRPRLLIADEPTTALDVTTQAQIIRLLRELVDEFDMGLMLITHDLGLVADVADRLAIMRHGEVVEAGETGAIFADMKHPYTRALYAASSHVPDRAAVVPQETPVLELREVVREYPAPRAGLFAPRGARRAVDGVSFTLKRGETLGLVGESGCGKSTLSRAILGLEDVQAGEIRVMGHVVSAGLARTERRRMQAVFQDPYGGFNPRWSVGRLVAEPFHLLDDPPTGAARRAAVAKVLQEVGLRPDDASKYIHEFSGGQRQRIAIARALIIEPDLIILDEAVSALDVSIRAQILDLLADLSARLDLSYLFISHDLSVVRAITDRVLVMQAGRIVEEGATEEVFRNPAHAYTRTLIAAAPDIEAALKRRRA